MKIRRRHLISLIVLLLMALMVYLGVASYGLYKEVAYDYEAESLSIMGQRMGQLFVEINDFPRDEGDDVLYLANSGSLRKYVNSDVSDKAMLRADLESDFLAFMEVNEVYYQLRYLDEAGNEIVRTEFDGEKYFVVDESRLQNKADRYYVEDTLSLGRDEIYVSKLDLNVENGVIEVGDDGEYVPVIRYAIHVFDDDGVASGIVVLNVYADYFLDDIRRLGGEGEISFLLDNDGYYLAHPNRTKEFSFMFDGKYSIFNDYFDAAETILSCEERRVYENEDYVFVYRHIHPTSGTFEMHQASEKILGENSESEYYWVLVTVSDKDFLDYGVNVLEDRFVVFGLVVVLIVALILVLLAVILKLNGGIRN